MLKELQLLGTQASVNMTQEEFKDYVNVDQNLEVTGELTNVELVQVLQERSQEVEDNLDVNDEDELPTLILCQKMTLVDYFRQFIQEASLQSAMPVYKQVEAMVYSEVFASKKQKTIDDYFN